MCRGQAACTFAGSGGFAWKAGQVQAHCASRLTVVVSRVGQVKLQTLDGALALDSSLRAEADEGNLQRGTTSYAQKHWLSVSVRPAKILSRALSQPTAEVTITAY